MELLNNPYSAMQKSQYDSQVALMHENHRNHDQNPDYWNILLGDIVNAPEVWKDKVALDFGCGHGRNVSNLLRTASFRRVDGVDISGENILWAQKNLLLEIGDAERWRFTVNNGYDLSEIPDYEYNFVMSTIVLQHICVHSIRYSLLKDIFRVLKGGGLFSFQMGFGQGHPHTVAYRDDFWSAPGTNSACDVRITAPREITDELKEIGFKDITYIIAKNHPSDPHENWIFIKAYKI